MKIGVAIDKALCYADYSRHMKIPSIKGVYMSFSFLLFLSTFFFLARPVFAFSTFYFNPQRKYIDVGGSQDVELRLNTDGDAVNAFSAFISYPSDMLEVNLVSSSGTFPIVAAHNVSSGSIEISEGSVGSVSGDVLIATLSLKGKKAGTATLSFGDGSAVPRYSDSSDSLSLSRSIAGFYTIKGDGNSSTSGSTISVTPQQQKIENAPKAVIKTVPKVSPRRVRKFIWLN